MTVEDMKNIVITFVGIAEEHLEEKSFKEMDNAGVEILKALDELEQLKEKATARKVKGKRFEEAICPCCLTELYETYWAFGGVHYCVNCGTAIDWSEGKE